MNKGTQGKTKYTTNKSAPLIDTIPNVSSEPEDNQETTFTRIVKASNVAYEGYDSFDDSFDEFIDESILLNNS